MNLEAQLAQAYAAQGVEEITIRVSRYAADLTTPEAIQVIVKHRGRMAGPWVVAIRGNPVAALMAALQPALAAPSGSVFD